MESRSCRMISGFFLRKETVAHLEKYGFVLIQMNYEYDLHNGFRH